MGKKTKRFILEAVLVVIALIFLMPFYFVLVNSVKDFVEILKNTAGLPEEIHWENFANAWENVGFGRAFWNTVINTILTDIVIVVAASMAAYRMVRHNTKGNRLLMMLFVASMVIPVQSILIPLIKEYSVLHLINTRAGLVIAYVGLGLPFSIYLYSGYVHNIPIEVEEAAIIDGCSYMKLYWRVVFPLLKPMTGTVVLLRTLWCWNDYLTTLLLFQKTEDRTIQLAINVLFNEYRQQWDIALPALVIAITPLIAFFLLMQKQFIAGVTSGAVKG